MTRERGAENGSRAVGDRRRTACEVDLRRRNPEKTWPKITPALSWRTAQTGTASALASRCSFLKSLLAGRLGEEVMWSGGGWSRPDAQFDPISFRISGVSQSGNQAQSLPSEARNDGKAFHRASSTNSIRSFREENLIVDSWERRESLHGLMKARDESKRAILRDGDQLSAIRYVASSVALIAHKIRREAKEKEVSHAHSRS